MIPTKEQKILAETLYLSQDYSEELPKRGGLAFQFHIYVILTSYTQSP